jgi:hypothetical protein
MKRRVVSVRWRASVRLMYPRSTPMGYAVRAKPTAATLENERVGARSGVRPLAGLLNSQK